VARAGIFRGVNSRRRGPRKRGEVAVAKNQKKVAKKQSVQAGRTLAGRTLANPNSRVKDKKLAASVLSLAAQTKQKKKK
jgi:hypothetical protein